MILCDYHVHSCFCDGENEPEEIVASAIKLGMTELGIVTHSYTPFDTRYCIKKDRVKAFQAEINRLKEKYNEKISVLCGVEQDIYSDSPTDGFDYVIGSVHYLKCGNEYCPIDENSETLEDIARKHFGGDFYALAEEYYSLVSRVAEITKPRIIGHLDLITKFNENERLFSESDEGYKKSLERAVDALLPYNIPFEVNTGAISRDYRSQPYPNISLADYIKAHGGRLIMSSDSHNKDTLCFEFEKWEHILS